MYADTDFLLALLKDEDWLQESAREVYKEHEEDIWTSQIGVIELMVVCDNENLDVERKIVTLDEMINVRTDMDSFLEAAHYIKNKGLYTFDALHVAHSEEDMVLSTDEEFQKLDVDQYNFREKRD